MACALITSTGTGLLATVRLAARVPVMTICCSVIGGCCAVGVALACGCACASAAFCAAGLVCAMAGAASARELRLASSRARLELVMAAFPLLAGEDPAHRAQGKIKSAAKQGLAGA